METRQNIPGSDLRGMSRPVFDAGTGMDAVLALLDPILPAEHSNPGREAARAALNGILGDHLVETANPLAIPMRLLL
jgi:hypothetical protein